MAIVKQSILGSISGKLGGIVGYELNGQNVIRSAPSYTKRQPTPLQIINRAKMKAVSQFLRPLKGVIAFGYKQIAPKGSRVGAFQTAQKYTFEHAIDYGEHSTPYVNPEKVMVFRGDLMPPSQLEVVRQETGIRLIWDKDQCRKDAVLIVLAYVPEEKHIFFEEGAAKAGHGAFDWSISERILSTCPHIHVYAGFYDISKDQLSDSVYGGCV